ncbi:MAG: hypothetical protein A4E48_01784 [Methanosaeta sp. PtaU1.Bin060]|nr:MAG: hypothetical protein A4E48_01784 [Methanosaeta sp. PtaU1.Bin060]
MVDNLLMIKAEEVLEKIEVGEPVEYENIIIFGDLDLSRLDLPRDRNKRQIIRSVIKIEYSMIKGDVFFDRSTFAGLVDFDGTVFTQAAKFSDSMFCEDAGFSEARFEGEANFSRAEFLTEANFSRARFGDVDFRNAKFHRNLNLASAKLSSVLLLDARLEEGSSLNLMDLDYSRIKVRWETIRDHLSFNGSIYLALTKNFRNLEQFEDEDECYYQYRKEKQARATSRVGKLVDRVAWLSCGYGVRPSHTILLSAGIILLFAAFLAFAHAIEHDSQPLQENQTYHISLKDAFYFSSMQFLGKNPENLHIVEGYEYLTVMESLVGWILMALFLITMSKVILR